MPPISTTLDDRIAEVTTRDFLSTMPFPGGLPSRNTTLSADDARTSSMNLMDFERFFRNAERRQIEENEDIYSFADIMKAGRQ